MYLVLTSAACRSPLSQFETRKASRVCAQATAFADTTYDVWVFLTCGVRTARFVDGTFDVARFVAVRFGAGVGRVLSARRGIGRGCGGRTSSSASVVAESV